MWPSISLSSATQAWQLLPPCPWPLPPLCRRLQPEQHPQVKVTSFQRKGSWLTAAGARPPPLQGLGAEPRSQKFCQQPQPGHSPRWQLLTPNLLSGQKGSKWSGRHDSHVWDSRAKPFLSHLSPLTHSPGRRAAEPLSASVCREENHKGLSRVVWLDLNRPEPKLLSLPCSIPVPFTLSPHAPPWFPRTPTGIKLQLPGIDVNSIF